ncbi:MAG: cell division protein FtsX [Pseudomonadota bacterium]
MAKLLEIFNRVRALLSVDTQADRLVPPTGFTVLLTSFTSGAMAFLAVFTIALSLATGRVADRWASELSQSSTIRISAPAEELDLQTEAVLSVLKTSSGVASARVLGEEEQRLLLEPWFGPELPLDSLPIPRLIEVVENQDGFDPEGLRLRLSAEAPGAFLDDHTRWRKPLVSAANSLRLLGWTALVLIGMSMAAMITLAARAALAANSQVIQVTRLVGARDTYIASAFVRRFTIRALRGSFLGVMVALVVVSLLPEPAEGDTFLTGLSFRGWTWLYPLLIPIFCAVVAFLATRRSAMARLNEVT